MSRPFVSAPRKKRPRHVGPIGLPSGDTTSFFFPPTVTVSVRWFLNGSVWATWFAHRGAARHPATITTKSAPKASADLLRRNRRSASRHGPRPATLARFASSSNAAGPSRANSVAGSVATSISVCPGALLLQAEQRPVVLVHRMHARAVVEVHPLREERR